MQKLPNRPANLTNLYEGDKTAGIADSSAADVGTTEGAASGIKLGQYEMKKSAINPVTNEEGMMSPDKDTTI
jgi:hypothetical protein